MKKKKTHRNAAAASSLSLAARTALPPAKGKPKTHPRTPAANHKAKPTTPTTTVTYNNNNRIEQNGKKNNCKGTHAHTQNKTKQKKDTRPRSMAQTWPSKRCAGKPRTKKAREGGGGGRGKEGRGRGGRGKRRPSQRTKPVNNKTKTKEGQEGTGLFGTERCLRKTGGHP